MPIKDPEKRKAANRKYREKKAQAAGRIIGEKAGQQRTISRCDQCPDTGDPCRDCYNAHRRTYRTRAAGYTKVYKPARKPMDDKQKKNNKPFKHRIAVEAKPAKDFLESDLFGCPGCLRKMRGDYRYCDRCKEKKNGLL